MSMNFRDALKTKLEDIPAAPLAPAGTYRFRISKQPVVTDISDGKYEQLSFPCVAVEALTVDPDELAKFGSVNAINNSVRFMMTKDPNDEERVRNDQTIDRLRNFVMKHLGMDSKLELGEAIDSSAGAEFIGEISHRIDKQDPEKIYAEIRRTSPLG